jgi:hypothetical protein
MVERLSIEDEVASPISSSLAKGYDSGPPSLHPWRINGTGMVSYDNDLPLPVLVPMKTSFPSAKALKLPLG